MEHPLIGVWSVEVREAGKPHVERVTHAYHPDGLMSIAAATYAAQGAWAATGERSATVAALLPIPPGEGFSGWLTLQASVQVADDDGAFQMDATVDRPTPSGVAAQHSATLVAKRFTAVAPTKGPQPTARRG